MVVITSGFRVFRKSPGERNGALDDLRGMFGKGGRPVGLPLAVKE